MAYYIIIWHIILLYGILYYYMTYYISLFQLKRFIPVQNRYLLTFVHFLREDNTRTESTANGNGTAASVAVPQGSK